MLIHRHRLNVLSRIWGGGGLPGMEGFGNLLLALDDESAYTTSGGPTNVVTITDRSLSGPSERWDASNGLLRNPSSANFNNYPTLWRGNAGEWFNRTTGTDITGNTLTFFAVVRPTNMGGQAMMFDHQDAGTGSAVGIATDGTVVAEPLDGTFYNLTPPGVIQVSTANIIAVTFNTGNYFQAWVNGIMYGQVGTPTGGMTISQVWSSLTGSGDWESPGLYVYGGVLSDAKIAEAGQWLSDKYALGQTWTELADSDYDPNTLSPELFLRPEELANPNRLLQTADFTNAAWLKTNLTVTGGQTDPDGGSDAALLTPTGGSTFINQDTQGFQAGEDDVFSIWWKRGPGHNGTSKGYIQIYDGVSSTFGAGAVPPVGWERIQISRTLDGSANRVTCRIWPDYQTSSQPVLIAFPQGEAGTSASAYQENGATAGGIVDEWEDQSSNNNDATQGTPAQMPLVQAAVLDGYAGALFDLVDDTLVLDSTITNAGACEYWIVLQPKGTEFYLAGTGTTTIRITTSEEVYARPAATAGVRIASSSSVPVTDSYLLRVMRDGSDDFYCEVNGVDKTLGTPGQLAGVMGTDVPFGYSANPGFVANIGIEIVIVSAALSAANRTSMLARFHRRYPSIWN